MNSTQYLKESNRTNPSVIPGTPTQKGEDGNPTYLISKMNMELLHAMMGCVTEAGEFTDQMKRHMIYGAPLDLTNLKEELGDVLWYVALAMRTLDTDFDTEFARNIKKLLVRYPGKFNKDDALIRNLQEELDALVKS